MGAVRVSDSISWVGVIDWNLRDFHGYETPRGSTYNAYLVQGAEKCALVDTVKEQFVPELLHRVSTLLDPAEIDLIVVNHVEPDHNSGLRKVMEACPNARVVASRTGKASVAEYHDGLVIDAVGADEVIDLGGLTLRFMPAPMVHWPDSMFSFCAEERVLMPNDGFGQHLASSARFADEVGMKLAIDELEIYFANILMPVGNQVSKMVEKLVEAGWEFDTIAPSHGVIWRGADVATAIEHYQRWTSRKTIDKAVVAYTTMWGSTDTLAKAITEGIMEEGVACQVFDLAVSPVASVTAELIDARAFVLGSSTIHHGMLYRAAGYLTYFEGVKAPATIGATFGSYGWGGGATKQISARLEAAGLRLPVEPFTVKFRPNAEELEAAREWGRGLAREIMKPPAEEPEA